MSARSLSLVFPEPAPDDATVVSVTLGQLRELRAAVLYLAAVAEANSAWDPDTDAPEDEPDDLRATSHAGFVLATLLGA